MVERFYGAGEEIELINDKLIESENRVELLEKQLAELREKLRLIPVTERLPEKEGSYETKKGKIIQVCYFIPGTNTWIINGITHWREIPELGDGECPDFENKFEVKK